jgi:hypothetical protein
LGRSDNQNESIFRHVYLARHATIMELLQRYCTEAHATIRKRLGVNFFYTDAQGDTVTVVTRKSEKYQGEWYLIGDIWVRFSSPRAAGTSYEQQRKQQKNIDTHASRLLGQSRQACPTLIPTCHNGETSQDDSLHKVFFSCSTFKGKDNNGINHLFRENIHEIYDMPFDIDVEPIDIPVDYYTTIANATEATGEGHKAKIDPHTLLNLFEYYKITKIGGVNNPYACAEWPGIHIP